MKFLGRLLVAAAVLLLPLAEETRAEMKTLLTLNKDTKPVLLRTKFNTYGTNPNRSLFLDQGYRLFLEAGEKAAEQTGLYSLFALAGNCEVTLTYQLFTLEPPRNGSGSGFGFCFETEDQAAEGSLMRIHTPKEGSGYLCRAILGRGKAKAKPRDEKYFEPSEAMSGKMALRRIKKELVFLVADTPDGELKEIKRLPFTDVTIRPLRLYFDPGGSPTAIDVRVTEMEVKAEELAGGASQLAKPESARWPWLLLPAAGLGGFWLWRRRAGARTSPSPASPTRS